MERALFVLQRLTALAMAPLVVVHLVVIVYAIHGGLTADEILSRTLGSVFWAAFYGLFVLFAAIHAPIGVRSVLREWTPVQPPTVDIICLLLFVAFLGLGVRAVYAVVGGV